MYEAKLRLFFDNTKLFGLYFAFSCKLFQYFLHIIRQITDSLLFHFLWNTKSCFGDGADDGSDGIAIAAMRYGKADGKPQALYNSNAFFRSTSVPSDLYDRCLPSCYELSHCLDLQIWQTNI